MAATSDQNPPAAGGDDPRICFCMRVHRQELIEAIQGGATTLDDLKEQTMANTGCGTCRIDLIELLTEFAPTNSEPS